MSDTSLESSDPLAQLLNTPQLRSPLVRRGLGKAVVAPEPNLRMQSYPDQYVQPYIPDTRLPTPPRDAFSMSPGEMGEAIASLGDTDYKAQAKNGAKTADDILRELGVDPGNPGDFLPSGRAMMVGKRSPAMTPFSGPDTGEVDPNAPKGYFSRIRGNESGANANAVNWTTRATGPYQFLPGSWATLMKQHPELGLTWDGFYKPSEHLDQHDAAMKAYTDASINAYRSVFGKQPSPGELYSMHFFGQAGGMKLLQNLDAPLNATVATPEVLRVNPWLKSYANRPGRDLLAALDRKMGGDE